MIITSLIFSALALFITYIMSVFFSAMISAMISYKTFKDSMPLHQTTWASLVVLAVASFIASFFTDFHFSTYLLLILISMGLTLLLEKRTKVNPSKTEKEFSSRMYVCFISSAVFAFIHNFLMLTTK